MDISIIDELPPGRTPIRTFVVRDSRKSEVYDFVRKNVELGRQAYVVASAIDAAEPDDEDDDGLKRRAPGPPLITAVEEAQRLQDDVFPDLRVELVHGRIEPKENLAGMAMIKRSVTYGTIGTSCCEC